MRGTATACYDLDALTDKSADTLHQIMEENGLVRVTEDAIELPKGTSPQTFVLRLCTLQLFFTTIKKRQYPNFCIVASYVVRYSSTSTQIIHHGYTPRRFTTVVIYRLIGTIYTISKASCTRLAQSLWGYMAEIRFLDNDQPTTCRLHIPFSMVCIMDDIQQCTPTSHQSAHVRHSTSKPITSPWTYETSSMIPHTFFCTTLNIHFHYM